jgi:hypothetical protein
VAGSRERFLVTKYLSQSEEVFGNTHIMLWMTQPTASYLRERQILGEIDSNVRPLGSQQVYNILQDPEQCAADPDDQRAYTRHRVYRRNELSAANISKRQAYLFEVEQLDRAEALVICCDEKAYHFGGTPNQHATLPINTSSYQSVFA